MTDTKTTAEIAALQQQLDMLHGRPFSMRNYEAMDDKIAGLKSAHLEMADRAIAFEKDNASLRERIQQMTEERDRAREAAGTLNIKAFSKLSAKRAEEGFKIYKNVPITYWTTALAGEVGELCNMIKKIERVAHGGIDGGSSYTAASLSKTDLAGEIGDIFTYLNLLAGLMEIDMEEAVIETFNSNSKKYGLEQVYTPKDKEDKS